MKINRKELVTRHNPVLHEVNLASPLTVGNGELCFTADITGMQSLYEEYKDVLPLCTQSGWGWHTKPVNKERYSYRLDDLVMTEYEYNGRTVRYPKKKMEGNEEVYEWLRKNPHRLNLAKIGLICGGKEIQKEQLCEIEQKLDLYEGVLSSTYKVDGVDCKVETVCDGERDVLGFCLESELLKEGKLQIEMEFPYGSHEKSASDFESTSLHETILLEEQALTEGTSMNVKELLLKRVLDRDVYYIKISCSPADAVLKGHRLVLCPKEKNFFITVGFAKERGMLEEKSFAEVKKCSQQHWAQYWEKGGIIRLNQSKDSRAEELERRIILSQYLMAINSAGNQPPQETGLTCNSWYGKMHLEMYLWHCAWLPLFHHEELLKKSMRWYRDHLKEAEENAARNEYKGARWPKMISLEGIDCPSPVAPLLVWQQPHIIYMLEMTYRRNQDKELLEEYWQVVKETADFMVDFVVWNEQKTCYEIVAPVIPVQECHKAEVTKNPAFELEYWRFSLRIAADWAERLGKEGASTYLEVAEKMAELSEKEGLYLAHDNCEDTFENFNRDHPSMLGAYGLIHSDRIDKKKMEATLEKVVECWNYPTLWGWDFAMMAMTAVRIGRPDLAVKIIMMDSWKNEYTVSGNNFQRSRADLPLYLPGNGGLLLTAALMTAGYEGCQEELPGFPKDGMWTVQFEDVEKFI